MSDTSEKEKQATFDETVGAENPSATAESDAEAVVADDTGAEQGGAGHSAAEGHAAAGDRDDSTGLADEAEVLRNEMIGLQEELHEARKEAAEMKDRFLRSRAELENFRRRATAEAERAREAGLDSAVGPVLTVFDDLKRALEAAETAEPSQIVPGVEAVLASLERNLESLGIEPVGAPGDRFDPDLHEALTAVPASDPEQAETIAEVFQTGFRKGDRLIRPARVVVYQG